MKHKRVNTTGVQIANAEYTTDLRIQLHFDTTHLKVHPTLALLPDPQIRAERNDAIYSPYLPYAEIRRCYSNDVGCWTISHPIPHLVDQSTDSHHPPLIPCPDRLPAADYTPAFLALVLSTMM